MVQYEPVRSRTLAQVCEAAEVACEDVLEHEQTGALPSTGAQSTVVDVSWHDQRVSFLFQTRECELVNHSDVTSYEHCMLLCCFVYNNIFVSLPRQQLAHLCVH